MNRSASAVRNITSACAALTVLASAVHGADPDPGAAARFAELVQAYRARDSITINASLWITLEKGEVKSTGDPVTLGVTWTPNATVFRINDITGHLLDGMMYAVSVDQDDRYFAVSYDEPLAVIRRHFHSLPFPTLAILLGDDDPRKVWRQLHPRTADLVPVGLSTVDDAGTTLEVISFAGEHGTMDLSFDPQGMLLRRIEHAITSGPHVADDIVMRSTYTFKYLGHQDFDPAALAFEAQGRRPVDTMLLLRGGGGRGAQPGQPAPGFVLATLDHELVSLEDLKGDIVVLDFWATWCGPCKRALPLLHDFAKWAEEEGLPVKVFAVNVSERAAAGEERHLLVRNFWRENGFTLPVLIDEADEVVETYRIEALPTTVIIDRHGVVFEVHRGAASDYDELLKREVRAILDEANEPDDAQNNAQDDAQDDPADDAEDNADIDDDE